MALSLSRRYRPGRFAEVVGQRPITETLKQEVATGHLAHAYLFAGPRGVGKTTLARILAKAVNCAKPAAGEPDSRCASCAAITVGRSLDVVEVDAASQTGVDHVRANIIEGARTPPGASKYKVFIIDEVHMLSLSAFNALLKILEEPPAHALFILATTEVHKVPETVISRCQRFDFPPLPADVIAERVRDLARREGLTIDDAVAETLAYRAQGSVRDAESSLAKLQALGEKRITPDVASLVLPRSMVSESLELLGHLIRRETKAGLELVHRLSNEGVDADRLFIDVLEVSRRALLASSAPSLPPALLGLDPAHRDALLALAKEAGAARCAEIVDVLLAHHALMRGTPVPLLPLELAVVHLGEDEPAAPLKRKP
jgi:DNA polymerase-3 subunit gamma/tau